MEKYDTTLAEATTPSLEALKAYSTGLKFAYTGSEEAAEPFFKPAAEIDPRFAMAYASLGLMYGSDGGSALARRTPAKLISCGIARVTMRSSLSPPTIMDGNWKPREGAADLRGVGATLSS